MKRQFYLKKYVNEYSCELNAKDFVANNVFEKYELLKFYYYERGIKSDQLNV